jgi:hypothetical protein
VQSLLDRTKGVTPFKRVLGRLKRVLVGQAKCDLRLQSADALHSGTRTLLTEIDISNPDGALTSGIYCSVELKIPRKTPSFIIPAEALLFNRNGLQAAVVENGKAEIRNVRVARDLGTRVEVDAGLRAGERVILNPPVTLINGSQVQSRELSTGPTT